MKNILIIGGSAGIGFGLVDKFLSEGYVVFSVSRNIRGLKKKVNKNLHCISADITSETDRNKIIEKLIHCSVVSLDVISNATYGQPQLFNELSIEEIRLHFETNFFAPLQLAILLLNHLQIDRFLNISSGAAEFPLKNLLPYCASKNAFHHSVKCLNLEYPNTKFANLRPGMVDTPLQTRWRKIKKSIFPDGNPYIIAKKKNQLLTVGTVAHYIFDVMNSSIDSFANDWNISNSTYFKTVTE